MFHLWYHVQIYVQKKINYGSLTSVYLFILLFLALNQCVHLGHFIFLAIHGYLLVCILHIRCEYYLPSLLFAMQGLHYITSQLVYANSIILYKLDCTVYQRQGILYVAFLQCFAKPCNNSKSSLKIMIHSYRGQFLFTPEIILKR